MRGPIGSSRTPDTALPSFGQTFRGIAPFNPLSTSTPKKNGGIAAFTPLYKGKFKCRYCPLQYNLESSRDRHEETTHHRRLNSHL